MGSGLGAVDEHGHAMAMGYGYHFFHGIDGAQHIRHVCQRHEAGLLGEEVGIFVEVDFSFVAHRHHSNAYALILPDELPGHDVAMMLHGGEYDFIAIAEASAIGSRHQIDGFGGAAREDDFFT